MKLNEKLARLRKEKGMTQSEAAESVKVSRQAVSKWESGGSLPSAENLRLLSGLYGVPVDYLLNEDERKPEDGNVPKERPGNSPGPAGEGKRKAPIKWMAIVLVVLMLVVFISVLFADKREEEPIWIDEIYGEEVEPNRSFHVGW